MSSQSEVGSHLSLELSQLPPLAKALGEFFASRGTIAYFVGGVVRDALLSRKTGDVDLVVDGDPRDVGRELADLFGGHSILLGEAWGTVRVAVPKGEGAELVDITGVQGDIRQDLMRRDFTVNSMAVAASAASEGLARVEPIDPCHGAEDLRAGIIRANSPEVFQEDPGRLLRAPRLARQLGFSIEQATADRVRQHAHLVESVAPERVRDELLKLLARPSVAPSLRLLDDLGLLCLVIPELAEARGVTQPKEHYWDVFTHCVETAGRADVFLHPAPDLPEFVGELLPRFPSMDDYFGQELSDGHTRLTLLRLAGLLHDIAKPATRTVDSDGRIRFLGHHEEGALTAAAILRRLRLSRQGTKLVSRMVDQHLRPGQMAQRGELPTGRAVYRYYRDLGEAAIDTLYLNLADYLAARGPDLERQDWAEHCAVIGHILQNSQAPSRVEREPALVDGNDIMREFALAPGPIIGSILELVREAHANGEIESKEEALRLVGSELDSGGGRA